MKSGATGRQSGNKTQATQAEEPSFGCEKVSMTLPLKSGCLTPLITIPLIIICGAQ